MEKIENITPITSNNADTANTQNWQNKIVYWLIGMPTLLILLFIALASRQVNQFNKSMEIKPDSVLMAKILPMLATKSQEKASETNLKWAILAQLEQESIFRRYNQGGLLIMSRIFVKYLGFLTGMILTILGAVFIIGKFSESSSTIDASWEEKIKINFVTASPGIIFGVLGTILMLSTILQHNDIVVQDSPLYLNVHGINSITAGDMVSKKNSDKTIVDDTSAIETILDDSTQTNK